MDAAAVKITQILYGSIFLPARRRPGPIPTGDMHAVLHYYIYSWVYILRKDVNHEYNPL